MKKKTTLTPPMFSAPILSKGKKPPRRKAVTKKHGAWFDGYTVQK
jgi:hypothetical protein